MEHVTLPLRLLAIGALASALVVPLGAPVHADTKPKHTNSKHTVTSDARDDGRRSFGVQPAANGTLDRRAFLSYSVTPGAVVRDEVAVLNISNKPVTLSVFSADAFNTKTGGFDLRTVGTRPTQVGAWLQLGLRGPSNQITVPGRSNVLVPIRMAVPMGALPGDHAGGIVASLRTQAINAQGQQVLVDERVGVRVYVRVAGQLRPHLSVQTLHADFDATSVTGKGVVHVTYLVQNTGNITLSGRQRVDVTGWPRVHKSANVPLLPQLLPGSSLRVDATVRAVPPAGRLAVTVTVHPLSLGGVIDPPLPVATRTVHVWALAWWFALVLALAGLLGYLVFRRSRLRRTGPPGVVVDMPSPREGAHARNVSARSLLAAMVVAGVALFSLGSAAPAGAATGGTLTFLPGKGLDITPTYAVSSGSCPAAATNVFAVATGHGFPAEGYVVISSSSASLRHDAPMVIHLQDTFNGFAAENATKLAGPYRLKLTCIDRLHQHTYASYVGTVTFRNPTHFTAPTPSAATRDKVLAAGPVPGIPVPGLGNEPGATQSPRAQTDGASPGATGKPSPGPSPTGKAQHDSASVVPRAASSVTPSWLLPLGLLTGAALLAGAVVLFRRERGSSS